MKYEEIAANKELFNKTSIKKFSSRIEEICKPLLDIGINNFNYAEFSADGKIFKCLTNNPTYPEIYLENNGMPIDPYLSLKHKLPSGLYTNIWRSGFETVETQNFVAKLNEFHELRDGCAIIKNHESGKRLVYHFSSFVTDEISCFEALELFTHYFEDQGAKLISEAAPIFLPDEKTFWKTLVVEKIQTEEKSKMVEFLKKINFNYYKCKIAAKKHALSTRETQCLCLMIQGRNIKDIGARLNLTSKTVEHYIKNIEIKLNCKTRIEVIVKILTAISW